MSKKKKKKKKKTRKILMLSKRYESAEVLDISLPEKLIGKSQRHQNKAFIKGASPGVSDELGDKNAIGGRRWDVATHERKVCNMEIEIVTFFRKGKCEVDRPYRLTGANPSRKQKCCSPSCL